MPKILFLIFRMRNPITCGICLGFPRQIQVNWGDWGDTMGISLTNAMVVGFACQWVGSFQRNPDDNETSMEPIWTNQDPWNPTWFMLQGKLGNSHHAVQVGKLRPGFFSWSIWRRRGLRCATPDLLVIGIRPTDESKRWTHCWPLLQQVLPWCNADFGRYPLVI